MIQWLMNGSGCEETVAVIKVVTRAVLMQGICISPDGETCAALCICSHPICFSLGKTFTFLRQSRGLAVYLLQNKLQFREE